MIQLQTTYKRKLADTLTPVSIYLRLRDKFANSILLESSDYHGNDNTFSYICCDPIARFEVNGTALEIQYPNGQKHQETATKTGRVIEALGQFAQSFDYTDPVPKIIGNGLFGYCAYDAVRHFENLEIDTYPNEDRRIPDVLYQAFRFVIAINHFNNELYLFEHRLPDQESQIERIENFIDRQSDAVFRFYPEAEERSNMDDATYLEMVRKGIDHCKRGDVFQIVLSRRYTRKFRGDEFNVYRALRSINPSPYLFYFDFGRFKLFGSSPEAQIVIRGDEASIHPIAGTFKRTGDDIADAQAAEALSNDPKENAEHHMLVDLARNDLSRHGIDVKVETLKEVQFYSHLIHLVSKVTGKVNIENPLFLVSDTFPAGTLSGAPKYRAMELINDYEPNNRGFYGGCIGYLGFNGDFNHAIMIRSFLSRKNQLHFQAGGGIVFKSSPQGELDEVGNKLRALRTAIESAKDL